MMNMDPVEYDVPPAHPGDIMKAWFMDGKRRSVDDVAAASGLPATTIQCIIAGTEDIDEPTAVRLYEAFGLSAETLYRMQVEYNHFKSHGTILPFEALPRLMRPEPA